MITGWSRTAALAGIAAVLFAGCGGGSSSAVPRLAGAGTGTGGGVTTQSDFSGLSSAPLAVGDTRAFTPAETGYTGSYTATSSAPGVVTVSPGSGGGPFTATGVGPGTATITVADGSGHTSTVSLTVGSIGFGSLASTPLAIGEQRAFTPTAPGTTPSFTVTSSNPGVISVSPASGAGPFTLTGLSAGTSTITVANGSGGTASMNLTVSGTGTSPTTAPSATPSTGPTATPSTGPTATPSTGPTATPSTGPTATPSTGPIPTPVPTATPTSGPIPTPVPTATPTSGPVATPTPVPTATPAAIGFSPASVSIGRYQTTPLSVTGNAGGTSFTATVADGSIATIVPTGTGTYSIVGDNVGSTTITFTDNLGHTGVLPVTVAASPAPVIELNPAGITSGGVVGIGANAVVLTPTENGYNGTFTATSSNSTVAVVTPLLLGKFAVATATQGSVIITVRDTNGNSASIGFTVQ